MAWYRTAGQDFYFTHRVPELGPFEIPDMRQGMVVPLPVFAPLTLSCKTEGWVGGESRAVESWSAPPGILLKVAGGSDFYIAPGGQAIVRVDVRKSDWQSDLMEETGLDREILVGPALVLALALRGTWCLHASAALFKNHLTIFLGESGLGKSTLAAYLSSTKNTDWRLAGDDILPVKMESGRMDAWPRFPQLKLTLGSQPGPGLPEHLPISQICILTHVNKNAKPELQQLPPTKAVEMLVRHTAGTRLFDAILLAKHLGFCAQAATHTAVYRLAYPHRRDTLPIIQELLENLC